MTAFYNENDPFAAQWLRNLIAAGHIAPGIVDERPIQEIEAFELSEFTQCHFFAGIGVWSHALRNAGWSDDRPIWTGSCPCQPFSNAGKKKGISDERHLWPYWQNLIAQRNPSTIVGEQVASKDGLGWLDLVSTDMEASSYAFGAGDLCAAGFDGAHIRQRLYFVGLADSYGRNPGIEWQQRSGKYGQQPQNCDPGGLGDALCDGAQPIAGNSAFEKNEIIPIDGRSPRSGATIRDVRTISGLADNNDARSQGREFGGDGSGKFTVGSGSMVGGLADESGNGWQKECADTQRIPIGNRTQGIAAGFSSSSSNSRADAPMLGRTPVDWLYCRDGKWRPVESGTFPLVDATPTRVGRLRAYGNALDAQTATEFCRTVKEICDAIRPITGR